MPESRAIVKESQFGFRDHVFPYPEISRGRPVLFWKSRYPSARHFSLQKEKLMAPQTPSLRTTMVSVLEESPKRPSFIKTAVVGAVFNRSPRLGPAATATVEDHANSLSVIPILESETNSRQAVRAGAGIPPACFL